MLGRVSVFMVAWADRQDDGKKRSAETKAAPPAPAKAHDRTALGSTLRFSRSASQAAASVVKGPCGPVWQFGREQKLDALASIKLTSRCGRDSPGFSLQPGKSASRHVAGPRRTSLPRRNAQFQ